MTAVSLAATGMKANCHKCGHACPQRSHSNAYAHLKRNATRRAVRDGALGAAVVAATDGRLGGLIERSTEGFGRAQPRASRRRLADGFGT